MSEETWRASWVKRFEVAAIAATVYPVLTALGRTLRWERDGTEHYEAVTASGRQPILALWHGRIIPAVCHFRGLRVVIITSENFDGEWAARILHRFGYLTARGSTSRGARRALLQLRRDMAAGYAAAFTVDGPRGPAYRAQPGAVWLAKATGNPVVAFHMEAARNWTTRSWDRAQLPKPWSRVAVAFGAPLEVPADADEQVIEQKRVELEARLAQAQQRAREMIAAGP